MWLLVLLSMLYFATCNNTKLLTADRSFGQQQAGPQIRGEALWTLCRYNRRYVQLGHCSSHFVECSQDGMHFAVRKCPFRSYVFKNNECIHATRVPECQDYTLNKINEETKRLVEGESFCANGAGVYHTYNGDYTSPYCSRQALVCHPNRRDAISVICAEGEIITQGLFCTRSENKCSNEATAVVRQFFLQRACITASQKEGLYSATKSTQQQYQPETQCDSWYVMCAPQPHIVYCEKDGIFDRRLKACRKWLPGDVCAKAGVCRNHEWQTISLGKCNNQYIYCEGSVGRLYSCENGMVFDGECKPRSWISNCDACQRGDRRPGPSCNEYYECGQVNSDLDWELKRCRQREAFNYHTKACQQDYTCAAPRTCMHGSSFLLNCRDFMYCTGNHYEMFSCPANTAWSPKERNCIVDPACKTSSVATLDRCLNGNTIKSTDCKSYQMCMDGTYRSVPCFNEYGSSAVACSHCSPYSNDYANQINQLTFPGQCQRYSRLPHPHDCAAYYVCVGNGWEYQRCESGMMYDSSTQSCTQTSPNQCSSSAQVQCRDGERIIHNNPSMCDRVTECRNGNWVDLQCPSGYIYDANSYNCIRGQCEGTHHFAQVLPAVNQPTTIEDRNQIASLPSNSIGEIPEFVAPSCHGNTRAPDQYDCSRFWQCSSSGRFQSMVCPEGSVYDVHRRDCVQGTCSPARCVERSFQPLEECGAYKTCYHGQWIEARCDRGKQFFNGKCTNVDCPVQNHGKDYYSNLQCYSGAVKPNPSNPTTYKFCQYGFWTERSCPEGGFFDWKVLGCALTRKSPTYQPKCYEGDRKAISGKCGLYEECQHGKWVKKACPHGYIYYNGHCMIGKCSDEGQPCRESSGVDGYRRVQHDCSKFYQCVHGKWMQMPCGVGAVFNERLSVCDHLWNVPECGAIPVV